MILNIHFDNPTPPYLQIVEQISRAVASGQLATGDALPSIRRLAERLRVNRNTVDKAFRELEQRGVVEIRRGKGAFVLDGGSPLDERRRLDSLVGVLDQVVIQAHHLRIDAQDVLRLLEERLRHFAEERDQSRRGEQDAQDPPPSKQVAQ